MDEMYSSHFKLVYTDWYIQDGQRKPFGNGIHPIVREFIQDSIKRKLNIDYYKILQYETEHKAIKFDHSELINFFVRNFQNNIISLNQVENDDCIYVYPLEIKTTLAPLIEENTIELNGEKYLWYLKDLFSEELLNHFRSGKVKILINIIHDPLSDDFKINLFEKQMNELGVDGSNIIFIGGSKFDEYYKLHPESKVRIYNGHLFIKQYVDMMKELPRIGNLGYMSELVDESDLDVNKIRPYKFLCNNRTMEKPHRAAIGYFAMKYDLLKEGKFSFIQKNSSEKLLGALGKVIKNIESNYIEEFVKLLPIELDTQFLSESEKSHFGVTNNMKEWYAETYVNLVTETSFNPNLFFSEKIFKPLSNLQPFIIIGDYGSLQELKRLGFKTFEPFIDETYDLEIDPYIRMALIEKEIVKLKNKTIEEIHQWYYSIVDILIYNKKHLYSFEKYECFDEIFGEIKSFYKKRKLI